MNLLPIASNSLCNIDQYNVITSLSMLFVNIFLGTSKVHKFPTQ